MSQTELIRSAAAAGQHRHSLAKASSATPGSARASPFDTAQGAVNTGYIKPEPKIKIEGHLLFGNCEGTGSGNGAYAPTYGSGERPVLVLSDARWEEEPEAGGSRSASLRSWRPCWRTRPARSSSAAGT